VTSWRAIGPPVLYTKLPNKKKKTTEAQRAGEEQINHELHEWTNVTNYSCHLLIRGIRDFSFFPLSISVSRLYNFLDNKKKENQKAGEEKINHESFTSFEDKFHE